MRMRVEAMIDRNLKLTIAIAIAATSVAISPTVARAQAQQPAKAEARAAAPAGDGGLASRIESLEAQLVDMQVVVGTLESLAKTGGGASAPGFRPATPTGGGDTTRLDALEAQIRQLTIQMQAISDQLRAGQAPQRRSDVESLPPPAAPGTGFGATTITPGEDPIGGLIAGEGPGGPAESPSGLADPSASVSTGALAPAGDGVEPKQLYETAYGYLLQRDYGAAQAAFDDFLKRFPNDSLSGNAQYWLGETHFVRGQYKQAASAFLKGYQTYGGSQKAADSLLKLAMSLDKLGQKDAACSSFSELGVKFPNAAQSIKARAQSERQRVGCG